LIAASARIVSTCNELSVVDDEPGHFACWFERLSRHVYKYEAQHPPLQRVLDAIGPDLAGVRPIGGPDRNEEGAAVIARTGNVDRTVFLMRLGVLPGFWIACAVVYLWARRYWGGGVAVLAIAASAWRLPRSPTPAWPRLTYRWRRFCRPFSLRRSSGRLGSVLVLI
jgi:hypothetical protein